MTLRCCSVRMLRDLDLGSCEHIVAETISRAASTPCLCQSASSKWVTLARVAHVPSLTGSLSRQQETERLVADSPPGISAVPHEVRELGRALSKEL
jgi:hypothetical protein